MWGWLLVLMMRGGSKRPLTTTTTALLITTIALAATHFGFGALPALIRFLLATFLASVIHLAWLQSLQQRQQN